MTEFEVVTVGSGSRRRWSCTVKTHINHLFAKLRLRDRAAAVVYAFDHDLVTPKTGRLPRPVGTTRLCMPEPP